LERVDFLVVQDLFLTESASLADVVLPAVSWAEADGTYTNLERRVQRAPKALGNPHSRAAADWMILTHLVHHWPGFEEAEAARPEGKRKKGKASPAPKPWTYANAQAVLDEISRAVPMYTGLQWAALGEQGRQWPWEAIPAPPRRFSAPGGPVAVRGDASQYPYTLVTGHLLFDGGTLLQPTKLAQGLVAPAAVGVNPQDAATAQLAEGTVVAVESASGRLNLPVTLDERVQPGTLWIPYSLPGAPVETLLDMPSDGVGTRVRLAPAR
jgi:predicted molibdopterin-dependent oxidoreductase YjgC